MITTLVIPDAALCLDFFTWNANAGESELKPVPHELK